MSRAAFASLLLIPLLAPASLADPFADARVVAFIEQLGSEDYREREAATDRLGALGEAALPCLRAALRSPNPEVARRAAVALSRLEVRVEQERVLAPTMVQLDAMDRPLADVLKELTRQSKCRFEFPEDRGRKPVSIVTTQVPFWDAVLQVCEAGELEIQTVDAKGVIRLQLRGSVSRAASVRGAVLIEAFALPGARGLDPTVLLQVWPEPKLGWRATRTVDVRVADDDAGQRLAFNRRPIPQPFAGRSAEDDVRMLIAQGQAPRRSPVAPPSGSAAAPSDVLQRTVQFESARLPSRLLKEFSGTIHGLYLPEPEPLVVFEGMELGKPRELSWRGVVLKATFARGAEQWEAAVELTYDEALVQHVDSDSKFSQMGLRFADAAGKPFIPGFASFTQYSYNGTFSLRRGTVTLSPSETGMGPPHSVTFWGRRREKSVEVPFAFRDVPLKPSK